MRHIIATVCLTTVLVGCAGVALAGGVAVSITDAPFRAVGDCGGNDGRGGTNNRAAIQAAIDQVARKGGGTVIIPPGKFRTAPVFVRSGVTLYLKNGAELIQSQGEADYVDEQGNPLNPVRCHFLRNGIPWYSSSLQYPGLLYIGEGVHDVTITGDGNGVIRGNSLDLPRCKGIYEPSHIHVNLIQAQRARSFVIENVHLLQPWITGVVIAGSTNGVIRNVYCGPSGDIAADFCWVFNSSNVLIEGNRLYTSDDGVVICTAKGEARVSDYFNAQRAEPCANIVVRNNYINTNRGPRAGTGWGVVLYRWGAAAQNPDDTKISNVSVYDNLLDTRGSAGLPAYSEGPWDTQWYHVNSGRKQLAPYDPKRLVSVMENVHFRSNSVFVAGVFPQPRAANWARDCDASGDRLVRQGTTNATLGTRFAVSAAGRVSKVRFVSAETGKHTVSLYKVEPKGAHTRIAGPCEWNVDLASFMVEYVLPEPVPVSAGNDYIVAVSPGPGGAYYCTEHRGYRMIAGVGGNVVNKGGVRATANGDTFDAPNGEYYFREIVVEARGPDTVSVVRAFPGVEGLSESRGRMDLAGKWLFCADPQDRGMKQGFMAESQDVRNWQEVTVPCGFGQCVQGVDKYTGAGWYRKEFHAPAPWKGRRAWLKFDAVNNSASVWLNGQPVGQSEYAFLPFRLDVSPALRCGQTNVLVVRADNRPPPTGIPYPGGWHHDGGILRGVGLETSEMIQVADVAVLATPGQDAKITVRVTNALPQSALANIRVQIAETAGGAIIASTAADVELGALKSSDVLLAVATPDAAAWSPDTPLLYVARVAVTVNGSVLDTASVRFGVRTIEAKGTRLLLNGKPLRILGFNRHEDTAATGLARNPETVREDLQRMKSMGANFVRIHYPMDDGTLDLCDELGILAMSEMPVGSSNEHAGEYLAKMIARDRNHPSVIFWSVSNESNEQDRRVVEWNDRHVQLARSLDPSRLAVHVSERGRWANPANHPLFTHDSVICLNGYPSELGRIWASNPAYAFATARQYWEQALEELHRRYPDKPILVTEFGYPTGRAMRETVDGVAGPQMQGRAIEAEFDAFHAPYVCGASIWCWADHPWPKGAYRAEVSPYGIFTRDRQRKGGRVEELVERLFKGGLPTRQPGDSAGNSKNGPAP